MRTLYTLLPLFLCSCLSSSSLSLYVGERAFEDSGVSAADEQATVALELLWGILPFGLGLEVGLAHSEDDSDTTFMGSPVNVEGTTLEGYVGARKTFREDSMFRPYIGAGLSYLDSEFKSSGGGGFNNDDSTGAVYGRAGLGWHLALFHVGIDYRYTTLGDADFANMDVDLDSGLVSIFGGLSF